ncbi:MAG: hypothetical protein Phyf2KO_00890 [Phycisphaerales bacterium]
MSHKESYLRVAEILADVLETDESSRSSVLERHCAGDESLRSRVLELLAAEPDLASDHPFADLSIDRQRADAERLLNGSHPGRASIGKYRVLRVLGRGGMSVVYECKQDQPSRRVALKLMDGRLSSPAMNRRLRLEAEVLGRLKHECIATVYEAGATPRSEGGQPYFAMELVEGVPLTEYADREGLDTRDRLELLARIAGGVEHAHQKGVIHRDLKPGNILVTHSGVPKILDFGIARVIDADIKTTTMHTSAGAILGTIAYMSPEQAAANPAAVDTRSDVYSLGVLGFELLSGRLPHEVENTPIHEAVRRIREDQPTLLATLNTSLRGDIDTMIAKALETDPDRRYSSAAAFADDLHRFLADQPIAARPPSTFYQLRKFSRRNKALVTALLAIGTALSCATLVSIGFAVSAEHSRKEAQAALDDLKVVSDYQAGQFSLMDPQQLGINIAQSLRDERERVLRNSGASPEQIAMELEELRAEIAGVNFTEIAFEAVMRNLFGIAAADIETRFAGRPMIASTLLAGLSSAILEPGLESEGLEVRDRAVEIRSAHLGPDHPETVSLELVGAWDNYRQVDRVKWAERIYRILAEEYPPADKRVLDAAVVYAAALLEGGNQLGKEIFNSNVDAYAGVHGSDPEETIRIRYLRHSFGSRIGETPTIDERRDLLREAQEQLGEHKLVEAIWYRLYHNLHSSGQFEAALELLEPKLEENSRKRGNTHASTVLLRTHRATLLEEVGRLDEAAEEFERLIALKEQLFDRGDRNISKDRHNLAFVWFRQGRYEEAEALFVQSLTARLKWQDNTGRNDIGTTLLWHKRNLAMVRVRMGKLDEGEALARETLAQAIQWHPGNWIIGHIRGVVGVALIERGDYIEAERELILAYDEVKVKLGPNNERARRVASFLSELYETWHIAEPSVGHDAKARDWHSNAEG